MFCKKLLHIKYRLKGKTTVKKNKKTFILHLFFWNPLFKPALLRPRTQPYICQDKINNLTEPRDYLS